MDRNSIDDVQRCVHATRATIAAQYAQYDHSQTPESTEELLQVQATSRSLFPS